MGHSETRWNACSNNGKDPYKSMTLTSEEILIAAPAQVSALIESMLQMRDRIATRGLLSGAAGSRRNLLDDLLESGGGSLGAAGEIVNIRATAIACGPTWGREAAKK